MKKVGGGAVLDHCLKVAADKNQSAKRRQAALAALEGRIQRDQPEQIDRVLAIAASDAPDLVLDQAFRRVRELPRDKVVGKLYDLFKTDKWKIRRAAGATVLQMSKVKDIEEFFTQLGRKARKNFSLGEVLTYGAYLGDLKEGTPRDTIDKYLTRGALQARLTAIGFFYTFGLKADIPKLKPLEDDKEKIPECEEEAECGWECEVPKKDDPKARETKVIETVGEFVRHCIVPQMEKNKPRSDKKEKKDEGKQTESDKGKSP